jgi:hypothetical protein
MRQMRDNITSSAGGGGTLLMLRWSVVRIGPREHGATDFTQQQSAYSKKGQTTLDVVCNLLSRPPRPQWEKLVLQIPANVNGGTKLLKTKC